MLRKVLLCFFLFASLTGRAQETLNIKLDGSEQGKSLAAVFDELSKKTNARFYFLQDWIKPISFQKSYEGQTLGEALDDLFLDTDLSRTCTGLISGLRYIGIHL